MRTLKGLMVPYIHWSFMRVFHWGVLSITGFFEGREQCFRLLRVGLEFPSLSQW